MTDPNYWLAAWLAVMAVWIGVSLWRGYKENASFGFEGVFAGVAFALNIYAALYCAGFVVVTP